MPSEQYLNQIINVKIDRPMGTLHPDKGFLYEQNYGFIPNTVSGDGEEVDVYVLNINHPIKNFTGRCIAIIRRLDEDDDKLIAVPDGENLDNIQIERAVAFREGLFAHKIIR